jgi:type IV pilus assembly protein PilM
MKIVNETNKVMRFYTDRFPEEGKLEQVLIVGSGSGVPGLGDFFTNELIMPARIASPWQELKFSNIEAPAKQLKPRLMAAAGLSLVQPQEIWS